MENLLQGSNPLTDQVRGQITKQASGKLKAPKHIIRTASSARALYATVRTQNLPRIAQWAALRGLIDGNPPYDQVELEQHGMAYLTNYNDLSAMSRFEKEGLGYWNLTHQADRLVNFAIDYDSAEAETWATIMSIEGDKVLKKWKNFSSMMGTHTAQLCMYGLSILLWPDERDWRPRVTELHRFLVPDQTQANLDLLTFCFFENDFTAQYLFEVYDEIKDKKKGEKDEDGHDYKHFWNVEALESLLLYRANSVVKASNQQFTDFMDLQSKVNNGDYTFSQLYGDGIRLITLLYKEYDGKITHYMFDTVYTVNNSFVYLADRQYHDFCQACAIFTVSPSEFTLHANKGIGHKVYAPCQAKNQLACSMVDMARAASTPMLRNDGGALKDPQQIKMFYGVPTDIGAAEFVDNRFGNNIQQVVGALTYLDSNLSTNLGSSGDDPAVPDADQGSKSPVQTWLQSYRESGVRKNKTAHFYSQMDAVYENIFAVMMRSKRGYPGFELADRWKRKCIEKGVPEEIFDVKDTEYGLPDHLTCRATRVGGDGSTAGVLLGLQSMQPILPMMGPREQSAYKKEMVLAAMGPDALAKFTQDTDQPDEVSSGASDAGVENAIMQLGFAPIFSLTNDQEAHFGVHIGLAKDTMTKVQQQQIDPIAAQKIFDFVMPHMDEHWQAIRKKQPFGEQFIGKYEQAYKQITQYAILNKKNAIKMYEAQIKEQQQAQENQQKVLSDIELKNLQAQADNTRKDRESNFKEARQQKESDTRADLKRMDVEKKAENDRLKINLEHGRGLQANANDASLEQNRQELAALTTIQTPGEA